MKRFLWLWSAAVVAAVLAFVVHLALRFENVRLGYEVGSARREQVRLLESRRLLTVEVATLRQAARVEAIARSRLDMHAPERDEVVVVTKSARDTHAALGARAGGGQGARLR